MSLRVAIVLCGVSSLRGGGGAERYFADLVEAFAARADTGITAILCTDVASLQALRSVGRDIDEGHRLIWSGRSRLAQMWAMSSDLRASRFDVVHLVQALPRYLPWLWTSAASPRRFAIALNINDSRLSHLLAAGWVTPPMATAERLAYRAYLSCNAVDGLMCWYERFVDAYRVRYGGRAVHLHAAQHCFVDTERFKPAADKLPWMVWSGRLVEFKRPMLFLEGIAHARSTHPPALRDWQVFMFGDGPLRREVVDAIGRLGLTDLVTMGGPEYLSDTLARSRLFVSTQDHENFTSLAMLEAMACGNAVLARDVGQTRAFVRPGENGLLYPEDTAASVGDHLLVYLRQRQQHTGWQQESRRITLQEHSKDAVVREFAGFWRDVHAWHERRHRGG